MANSPSLRLLATLPVPDTTWEPIEPKMQVHHHPRGILRNVSGVHEVVVLEESPNTTRSGNDNHH